MKTYALYQKQTYPKLRLLDIYKSCFQDYMGAEHLVKDKAQVEKYLDYELRFIDEKELQPWLYESCGVRGRYVRVGILAIYIGTQGNAIGSLHQECQFQAFNSFVLEKKVEEHRA